MNLAGRIFKKKLGLLREGIASLCGFGLACWIQYLFTSTESVLGIGLGVPGIVEYSTGVIRYSAHFDWQDVSVKDMLARELQAKVPIFVDNRTISATLGEKWFGAGRGVRNFVCLNCGEAVGAGMVVNGEIYRGGNDGAGEIGYISLVPDGPLCFCGKRGCLESLISLPSIMKSLGEIYQGEIASRLYLQERMEERRIQSTLENAFSLLGEAAAIFINLLAPERIVFAGELSRINARILLEMVRRKLREKALEPLTKATQLICSLLQREEEALGGASLVLEGLFGSIKLGWHDGRV